MREILFRGKSIYYGVWFGGGLIQMPSGQFFIHNSPHWEEVIPETVGQYTGLKDKNGINIFEGDIIATRDRKYKYYVVFENGSFICYHLELKDTVNGGNLRWGLLSRAFELKDFEIEVIGNIYDNPDKINSKPQ